jgi:hypothetical protein
MKKSEPNKLTIKQKLIKFHKGEVKQFNTMLGIEKSVNQACDKC